MTWVTSSSTYNSCGWIYRIRRSFQLEPSDPTMHTPTPSRKHTKHSHLDALEDDVFTTSLLRGCYGTERPTVRRTQHLMMASAGRVPHLKAQRRIYIHRRACTYFNGPDQFQWKSRASSRHRKQPARRHHTEHHPNAAEFMNPLKRAVSLRATFSIPKHDRTNNQINQ